ncbi:hypothetical protein G7081_04750 [Vagococcus coleopterorum]|uniref:DUF7278 domain-containing protein n=1 Tax=Vagococcus coleopterorum TaxID=2714946 RepID=A0A6G8ANC1_9ENTE|nr:hypothetical protein [Vagococcus coleopterorum]QIL46425.1 hypothetical protein G7081_04750 [Vagococcus coleopterorum]
MNYYDYMQLSAWQGLSDEHKLALFEDAMKPTFEERHTVGEPYMVNLRMTDAVCRTLAVEVAGQTFYFLPGQEDVDLGKEELASDVCLKDQIKEYSHLRNVTIEPMFVARKAKIVGVKDKGYYDIVTGQYVGDDRRFYEMNEARIKKELTVELDFEASLSWEYPPSILARNMFYMERDELNPDRYYLYQYEDITYSDIWLEVYSDGFQLLSEDAWEYVFAPKEENHYDHYSDERILLKEAINPSDSLLPEVYFESGSNPEKSELTAETGVMKPVALPNLDGQPKSVTDLAERLVVDVPKSNQPLSPARFNYRAAIIFYIK